MSKLSIEQINQLQTQFGLAGTMFVEHIHTHDMLDIVTPNQFENHSTIFYDLLTFNDAEQVARFNEALRDGIVTQVPEGWYVVTPPVMSDATEAEREAFNSLNGHAFYTHVALCIADPTKYIGILGQPVRTLSDYTEFLDAWTALYIKQSENKEDSEPKKRGRPVDPDKAEKERKKAQEAEQKRLEREQQRTQQEQERKRRADANERYIAACQQRKERINTAKQRLKALRKQRNEERAQFEFEWGRTIAEIKNEIENAEAVPVPDRNAFL